MRVVDVHVTGLQWVTMAVRVSKGKVRMENWKQDVHRNWWRTDKHYFHLLNSVAYGDPALNYETVLELVDIYAVIEAPRYVTHQLVRHRLASYYQESQRYTENRIAEACERARECVGASPDTPCSKAFMEVLRRQDCWEHVLEPVCLTHEDEIVIRSLARYVELRSQGLTPEKARAYLPQCVYSTVLVKMNLRELLHVLALRLHPRAQREHAIIWSTVARMVAGINYEIDTKIPVATMLLLKHPKTYSLAYGSGRIHSYELEKWVWFLLSEDQFGYLKKIITGREDIPSSFKGFMERVEAERHRLMKYIEKLAGGGPGAQD